VYVRHTNIQIFNALLGMNFARKTKKHPEWIWTTFEHKNNAPNCDDIKPDDKTNKNQ
jgi:hypothetical protein